MYPNCLFCSLNGQHTYIQQKMFSNKNWCHLQGLNLTPLLPTPSFVGNSHSLDNFCPFVTGCPIVVFIFAPTFMLFVLITSKIPILKAMSFTQWDKTHFEIEFKFLYILKSYFCPFLTGPDVPLHCCFYIFCLNTYIIKSNEIHNGTKTI